MPFLSPITEVGSLACSFGWFAACFSFLLVEKSGALRMIATLGILVSLAFIAMKIVPGIPGHFSGAEWIALAIWLFAGFASAPLAAPLLPELRQLPLLMYTFAGDFSTHRSMIPYLHLGPLTIPTFGLMVALALITAAYILQADFDRRGFKADAFTMITIAGLAWNCRSQALSPARVAQRIFCRSHRAHFYALWLCLVWRISRWLWHHGHSRLARSKLPLREFLDACSPAACLVMPSAGSAACSRAMAIMGSQLRSHGE